MKRNHTVNPGREADTHEFFKSNLFVINYGTINILCRPNQTPTSFLSLIYRYFSVQFQQHFFVFYYNFLFKLENVLTLKN